MPIRSFDAIGVVICEINSDLKPYADSKGKECAAFAISDLHWGQALHIAIVGEFSEVEISHYLEAALGEIAKPKGVHSLVSLPLLGIGKVDRLALTKMVENE